MGVEGCGGFVEDEDGRIAEHCAGDAEPLALTAGELYAAVTDIGLVALFLLHNEVVGVGYLGCGNHLLHCGTFHSEGYVVENGVVEKDGLLVHVAHELAQRTYLEAADIVSVY